MYLQRFAVVAFTLANFTWHVDIGQEIHLNAHNALTLTGLTPSTLDIEREPPRLIATQTRLRHLREQITDDGKGCGIGSGIRARCTPNRRLININHLVQMLQSFYRIMFPWLLVGAEEFVRQLV